MIARTARFLEAGKALSRHLLRTAGGDIRRAGRKSRPEPRQTATDGFALIDVLVGLALVGVISSLMIVFLSQARTMIRIGNATQMQIEVDAASRFLESAIAGAEPLPLSQSSPDEPVYLSGNGVQLQFSGIQAIGFGSSALREISVALPDKAGADDAKDLQIMQKPRRGGQSANAAESQPVSLISGVASIAFEYLDGSTHAWSGQWSAPRRLPLAVRFRISVVRDGATYSSDGLARLTLAAQQPAS